MSIPTLLDKPLPRESLSRGGQARWAAPATTARWSNGRHDAALEYWTASADSVAVFLAELRAHGEFSAAYRRSGLVQEQVHRWRKRFPEFDVQVGLAVEFSESQAINYADWLRARTRGREVVSR